MRRRSEDVHGSFSSCRCEHLEEQLNDLSELHQNEIFILKQELASMEEKVAYQSYEQGRDVQVRHLIIQGMLNIYY